jgi:type II secretory pathway pseudopilin PulG
MLEPVAEQRDSPTTGVFRGACGAGEQGGEHGVAAFELMLVALIGILILAISMPALLRSPPGANDTGARANLTNAVISAKAAYSVVQSYSWDGSPLSPLSFDTQDPAFSWTTGSCSGQSPSCVSEQVVDVNAPADGQGVVTAVWSSATRTCWFAVDLESVPRALGTDRSGTAFDPARDTVDPELGSGILYARSHAGATTCSADDALRAHGTFRWSSTLAAAAVIG